MSNLADKKEQEALQKHNPKAAAEKADAEKVDSEKADSD